MHLVDTFKSEVYSSFNAVKVIIKPCSRIYKKWGGYSAKVKSVCKFLLEIVFNLLDCSLAFHKIDS